MCGAWLIYKYNCGHEDAPIKQETSPFCLFKKSPAICERDIGAFRVINIIVNDWCVSCQPIAAEMRSQRQPNGQMETPTAPPEDLSVQARQRTKLRRLQCMSARFRGDERRLLQLNGMARNCLRERLRAEDMWAPEMFAWMLRYIQALPEWLDRPSLVAELAPWFATMFDEDLQVSLRPTLRAMKCEFALDDVMMWTQTY
ncbi:hypothetical protein F4804DRAFT_309440 [Jackrogersella minutella]|nr:hypothetical protein F4804DRAFT_309440 [Jackrogersella minutella]